MFNLVRNLVSVYEFEYLLYLDCLQTVSSEKQVYQLNESNLPSESKKVLKSKWNTLFMALTNYRPITTLKYSKLA